MEYRFDDRALHAEEFLRFVNQVWPGDYDPPEPKRRWGEPSALRPGTMERWWGVCAS